MFNKAVTAAQNENAERETKRREQKKGETEAK